MFANGNSLLKYFMTPLIETSPSLQHSVLTCSARILRLFEFSLRTLSKRRSRRCVLRANNTVIIPEERWRVGVQLLRVLGCRKGCSLGNIKVNAGWNRTDSGTDSLEISRYPRTANTLGELVRCPLIFAISRGEIKVVDRVPVKSGFPFLDKSVVPVDPHWRVVVRDRKGEDLAIELLLALHQLLDCYCHWLDNWLWVLTILLKVTLWL